MSNVVVGLGSNLGDRLQNLQFAVDTLRLVPKTRVAAVSRVYETEPVGFTEQPDFLNAAVLLETDLSPKTVLGICLGIEAAAGRRRTIKDGPRILDLDVLLYESVKSDSFELTLPHPRILERAFVLLPLSDLFPSGRALGFHFAGALRDMDTSGAQVTLYSLKTEE
ncbi:MAG: 2-amino-4-hydroxy-6-hydroxymethyldihydropteridine diphosphokinase [Clostridia bacterium]|nr:2-amino-4-hydroxy-6-hydroxymethyldihydropteridine diphosphokinase [Clostridia bacterium]